MKEPYLYFEVEMLKKYIKFLNKGLLGTDYELMTAIIMRSFFKTITKSEYKIGFRLKDSYVSFYQGNQEFVNFETFKRFYENHKEENIDSDFALLPRNKSLSPIILQAKRFGKFQKDNKTEGFIDFLKKIEKKYSKTNTTLIIFFDGHKGLNIFDAHQYLKSIEFPFRNVMFINGDKNDNGDWKLYIGEIYPSFGYNEYEPTDMI